MSYIKERGSQLILTKVTNLGRKAIASGDFNFSYYSIGDSEVDYNNEGVLSLIKTKDDHPTQTTFLSYENDIKYIPLTSVNSNVVEFAIRNKAKERGFFDKCIIDTAVFLDECAKISGVFSLDRLDGTKILDLNGVFNNSEFNQINDGDILKIKLPNLVTEINEMSSSVDPNPILYFALEKDSMSAIFNIDRFAPSFNHIANGSSIDVAFWILPGKDNAVTYYSPSGQTIEWNSEMLEFYENCYSGDTKIWNFNRVFCDDVIGTIECEEDFNNYGSQNYSSLLVYLNTCGVCTTLSSNKCDDNLQSSYYPNSSLSIIHFSNFNTKNEYGEYLYIDEDKKFYLCLPELMWHNRYFGGSKLGDKMGMRFVSDVEKKYYYPESLNLEYYDLLEDAQFIDGEKTSLTVGKVFPKLKIVIIENEELQTVLSYKSNRNYSLPPLKARQITPVNGVNTGILPRSKRLYITYTLSSGSSILEILPQGVISYLDNVGNIDRDVDFTLEDVNQLPYMRNILDGNYDGMGFYANKFKILYQIQDIGVSPKSDEWTIVDFTNNIILNQEPLGTIEPLIFENQIANENQFILTQNRVDMHGLGIYDYSYFCISSGSSNLTMGDEQLFVGNVDTYIGATVYKKIMNIIIDSNKVINSDNLSYSSGDKKLSEISFYNSDYEQIAVSKLSRPIPIRPNSTTEIEINFDF